MNVQGTRVPVQFYPSGIIDDLEPKVIVSFRALRRMAAKQAPTKSGSYALNRKLAPNPAITMFSHQAEAAFSSPDSVENSGRESRKAKWRA